MTFKFHARKQNIRRGVWSLPSETNKVTVDTSMGMSQNSVPLNIDGLKREDDDKPSILGVPYFETNQHHDLPAKPSAWVIF